MSRAALVGLLLFTVAIACGAWFLSGDRGGPVAEVREPVRVADARPVTLQDSPEVEARESVAIPADEPSAEATPATPLGPAPAAESVMLNGAAVRLDGEGLEHGGEDGSFTLVTRRGPQRAEFEVEVHAGAWSLPVAPDASLFVRGLELAGIPIVLDPADFIVPEGRFLELRGVGLQSVLLHVVSAAEDDTAVELDGVEVWPGPYGFPTPIQHPGTQPEGEPIVRGASSPVSIPARKGAWRAASQYFVRAPGHAWGSVDLDHRTGGERTLTLLPAAALEVELLGNADWLEPEVRLWPPSASQWDAYAYSKRAPDAEDRAVFEDLAPGTYFVSVERGWADRRTSYGSQTVDVVAGERLTVQLRVDLPTKPEAVRVEGTFTLPLAWGRENRMLVFGGEGATEKWLEELELPVSAMRELPGAPPGCVALAWEVELPLAGSYRLEAPLLCRRALEVPATGLFGVDIVAPPPAEVEVKVVDTNDGSEIAVDELFWSLPRVEGILSTSLHEATLDPERGRVVFRAPAAEIQIDPRDRSLLVADESRRFELKEGRNLVELQVQKLIGVRFTFRDGEATVPWDWSWRLSAHRVGEEGRDRARSVSMLWFLEGGTYELRSNGIPGFQSIDGTRIQVVEGRGVIDVEIPLVRE